MLLSDISIRRPVLATVLSLAIVLVGLMAYSRLTVREYPNIDEPVITVETTYRGASAEIIESQVTVPLEGLGMADYAILDAQGRMVQRGRLSRARSTVPVGHLDRGTYLIRVDQRGSIAQARIILQ